MTSEQQPPPETATARVELCGPDWRMHATVTVPTGPMRLRQMLPLVQSLASQLADRAGESVTAGGETISCKKGCGACCRQLVPVAEVEAREIGALVEAMPEPRRSEVRARFADARRRLEVSGLLAELLGRDQWAGDTSQSIGPRYFAQGIPCPFLEEESCSIHPDRPTACREYLVTSPAENCARPTPETVRMVPVPLKVWTALSRFDEVPAGSRYIRWVPLILAPEWAEAHPDEPPPRPGPELLQELFEKLNQSARASAPAEPGTPTRNACVDDGSGTG